MDIDAVYTWVNHSDPEWVEWYETAQNNLPSSAQSHESANNLARFQSRNELFYSIRSIRRYAPWIDRIFVVTNCALPNTVMEDAKVISVSHEEIFADTSCLPTFNSHAIEANLHRVPGLSERFLYFNDDFFLSKPVSYKNFFSESGKSYVFLSKHDIPYDKKVGLRPVDFGAINTAKLLEEDFDCYPVKKLHHAPYPMLKSTLFEIESRYGAQLLETMRHKFRHVRDLPLATTLHAYYALANGYAEIGKIDCRYIDIGDPLFVFLIAPLSPLRRGKYQTFCLNEVGDIDRLSGIRDYIVKRFLKKMFDV